MHPGYIESDRAAEPGKRSKGRCHDFTARRPKGGEAAAEPVPAEPRGDDGTGAETPGAPCSPASYFPRTPQGEGPRPGLL